MRQAFPIFLLTLLAFGVARPLAAAPAGKAHRRAAVVAPAPQPEAAAVASPTPVQIQRRFALPLSPTPSQLAPQCRAQCAKTRYACLLGGDDSECDPRWTRCVVQCDASGYARLPSLSAPSALRTGSTMGPR